MGLLEYAVYVMTHVFERAFADTQYVTQEARESLQQRWVVLGRDVRARLTQLEQEHGTAPRTWTRDAVRTNPCALLEAHLFCLVPYMVEDQHANHLMMQARVGMGLVARDPTVSSGGGGGGAGGHLQQPDLMSLLDAQSDSIPGFSQEWLFPVLVPEKVEEVAPPSEPQELLVMSTPTSPPIEVAPPTPAPPPAPPPIATYTSHIDVSDREEQLYDDLLGDDELLPPLPTSTDDPMVRLPDVPTYDLARAFEVQEASVPQKELASPLTNEP
jgi:hypothetical protein